MISVPNQELSFFGMKYARLLKESVDARLLGDLKKKYRYIALYSYTPIREEGFACRVQQTPIINLSPATDEIFQQFHKNTRQGIEYSRKAKGLTFVLPARDHDASYEFYRNIKKKDCVKPDLKKEFTGCFFANAYLNGRLIVSLSFYDTGRFFRAKHFVSLRKEMDDHGAIAGHATRRLIWELCVYGKSHGYRFIDLGGVNFREREKKGVADFKMSFGGEIKDMYICRYETAPFRFARKIFAMFGGNIN